VTAAVPGRRTVRSMATLKMHTRGHQMVIEAVNGPVTGIACEIRGPNVNRLHDPHELAPDDGLVIVAVRKHSAPADAEVGSVKVSWDEDGGRRSTMRTWN
jgi:hypothetical protein